MGPCACAGLDFVAHLTGLRLLNLTWVPSVAPLTFLAPLRALTALSLAFTFASEAHLRRRARVCMHVSIQ